MKTTRKPVGIITILALVMVFFTCTAFAFSRADVLLKDFSNLSEEDSAKALNDKDFHTLISEINALNDRVEMSDLIFHADALRNQAANLSEEEILKEILSPENSDTVKVILLQINRSLGNTKYIDQLEDILSQDNIDFEVKRNALLNMYTAAPDADLYEKLARGSDYRMAFHALKMLNTVDADRALIVSKDIINNFDGTVTDALRAALKVEASYIANNPNAYDKIETINFCAKLLEQDGFTDEVAKDTVIFALSDMLTKESITYIVRSTAIDDIAKGYCIDQNYTVLKEMLTHPANKEDIVVVLDAMEIYPINEIAELLPLSLKEFNDKQLEPRVGRAIEQIQKSGNNATGKY